MDNTEHANTRETSELPLANNKTGRQSSSGETSRLSRYEKMVPYALSMIAVGNIFACALLNIGTGIDILTAAIVLVGIEISVIGHMIMLAYIMEMISKRRIAATKPSLD